MSVLNVKHWPDRQTLLDEFDKYEFIRYQKRKSKSKTLVSVPKKSVIVDTPIAVSGGGAKGGASVFSSDIEVDIMGNPIGDDEDEDEVDVDDILSGVKVIGFPPPRYTGEVDVMGNPIDEDIYFLHKLLIL